MTLGRTRGARGRTRERQRDADRESDGLTESVVTIRRVAKTVAGGRRFTFNALVVVGDGKGKIGFGLGKAAEVPLAVQKGGAIARRSLIEVSTLESSVPQQVVSRFGGAQVLLRPAAPGTGVRASAAVRAVVQAAGVRDILTKSQGSNNPINVVQATIKGLQMMRDPRQTISLRRMVRGEEPLPEKEPEAAADYSGPTPVAPQPVSSDQILAENAEEEEQATATESQEAETEATAEVDATDAEQESAEEADTPAAEAEETPAAESEEPATAETEESATVEESGDTESSDGNDDENEGAGS
ncbi:MAG: 30S ribosomal protein S5 [Dehalococcoidia bacterium]|nr:30S ribosomal protein S5 [Dehalococcoidia bacterium]